MEKPFATGHCLCGAVSFTVTAAPIVMVQCYCKDCQRTSGTGHVSNARFRREDVSFSGETKTYTVKADSGNLLTRHFCPTCGSRLYIENSARPGFVNLPVGSFDEHAWYEPQSIVYSRGKPVWDVITEDIPCYETMPPPA